MAEPNSLLPPPLPRQRLVSAMRVAAAVAIIIAAVAVVLVARGGDEPRVHIMIAAALGIGLSVLLGMALMGRALLGGRRENIKKDRE